MYLRVDGNGEFHNYFVFFDLKSLLKIMIRKYEKENLFLYLSSHSKTKMYYITYKQYIKS